MEQLNGVFQMGWPIVLMVVIFYFLLWRPQKKQQKERNELLSNLKKGKKVVTVGGIYGTIMEIDDDVIMLEVADKTVLKFARSSVARVLTKDDK